MIFAKENGRFVDSLCVHKRDRILFGHTMLVGSEPRSLDSVLGFGPSSPPPGSMVMYMIILIITIKHPLGPTGAQCSLQCMLQHLAHAIHRI